MAQLTPAVTLRKRGGLPPEIPESEKKNQETLQLLICRMLKGNQEFRVSLVKINPEGSKTELLFEQDQSLEKLSKKIAQSEYLKTQKYEIKNKGERCKKSKQSGDILISKSDCGKIKSHEFHFFSAILNGRSII